MGLHIAIHAIGGSKVAVARARGRPQPRQAIFSCLRIDHVEDQRAFIVGIGAVHHAAADAVAIRVACGGRKSRLRPPMKTGRSRVTCRETTW